MRNREKKSSFLFLLVENEIKEDNFPGMEISWPKFFNFTPLTRLHERTLELFMCSHLYIHHIFAAYFENKRT